MHRIYTRGSLLGCSDINSMHYLSTTPLIALPCFHLLNWKRILQVEINTKDVKLVKTNISSLYSKRHLQSIWIKKILYVNKEILYKCLLECKDEILIFINFTSLVFISTMIALLVILFIIKLYARNNTFKYYRLFEFLNDNLAGSFKHWNI